jgi:uncharacterized protein
MKIIFDCNLLVSGFIFKGGTTRKSWDKAKANHSIIISRNILDEYKRIFSHSKFDKYLTLEIRLELILEIQSVVKIVSVIHKVKTCRDPKDDMYLELDLSGKADSIVSGDADLLVLNPFEGIPITTAREFLDRFS